MIDPIRHLSQLRRPGLLIRAARAGMSEYRRDTLLPRLFGMAGTPRPGAAVDRLISLEGDLDDQRRAGLATYSTLRHIEVLIALMAEARLIATPASVAARPEPG